MICKRCGKCCQLNVEGNYWKKANLTAKQKEKLLKERKTSYGCKMLVYVNEKPTCLIQKLFGYDAKPKKCKEYICDI